MSKKSESSKHNQAPLLFNTHKIRRHWDAEKELWYFSVVDVVRVLTESPRPRKYWNSLKVKLSEEGNQLSLKLGQLRMRAPDGKMRLTDVANTQTLFRLIQSIPSPKAEPFKLWLAKVGYERLEENEDPELSIDRAMQTYLAKGYSRGWIHQRLRSIEVRKELVDEWENRGVTKGLEYAILTDEITKAWADVSVKEYKQLKKLKKENLRDNMTNLELVLNMLGEVTTKEISQKQKPVGLAENKQVAKKGGQIAGVARQAIELQTGEDVVSTQNNKSLGDVPDTQKLN